MDGRMDGRKGIHVFQRLGLFGRRYYFNGRAGNGQIVAGGEAYNSRAAVFNGIRALAEIMGATPSKLIIYDQTNDGRLVNVSGEFLQGIRPQTHRR